MSETTVYTDFRLHANHLAETGNAAQTRSRCGATSPPPTRERVRLIADLGDSAAMVSRNHGSLNVAATVAQAFVEMFYLEKAARSQLLAQAAGQPLIIPPRETIELTARQWESQLDSGIEWPALLRRLEPTSGPVFAH